MRLMKDRVGVSRQKRCRASQKSSGAPRLSRSKKALFAAVVVVALLMLVEFLLAMLGVQATLVTEDPFVGFQSKVPLFVEDRDHLGRAVYRTTPSKRGLFNEQSCSVKKTRQTYRIFCLGGSTTHGRPYSDRTSFVGWLRAFLEAAAPHQNWEVINCGGVSYASYRVATLMEELVRYDPDQFIVYSGHNEFLERRTYTGIIEQHPAVTRLQLLLHRSRIVSVMRSAVRGLRDDPRETAKRQYQLTGEVAPLLDAAVGLEAYHRDDALRRQIINHYEFNLGRMVTLARAAGADVVFVQPAVNLKDFSPFKSQHRDGLDERRLTAWEHHFDRGVEAAGLGDHATARDAFERALEIDDRYAALHYELGKALFALGDAESAYAAFERALDEDVCPLRMLPAMRSALGEVARRHKVDVVDFAGFLEARSREEFGHSILGDAFLLDHVHPTIAMHRLLGERLVDYLIARGVFRPADDWNAAKVAAIAAKVEGSLDERDHALACGVLAKVLRWAGKVEEADRLIDRASLLDEDPEVNALVAGKLAREGKVDQAIDRYEKALRLNPRLREPYVNLGNLLRDEGRLEEAVAQYQQALRVHPGYAIAHHSLGETLTRQGRLDDAIKHFQDTLRIDPAYPEAHISLGIALMQRGRFEEALSQHEAELRADPRSVRAQNECGNVLVRLGRPGEAVERYREALLMDPRRDEVHVNLGLALEHLGQIDDAIAHYRDALRINPDSTTAHNWLGSALLRQGNHKALVEHFQHALQANPDLADGYYYLGVVAIRERDYRQAAQLLEQALEIDPTHRRAYAHLGRIYMSTGRFAQAVDALAAGLRLVPNDVSMAGRLAWLLATCPDAEFRDGPRSLALAKRVCELTEYGNAHHLDILAAAYAESGQFRQAVETVRRAISLPSSSGRRSDVDAMRARLELYRAGRPFRAGRE